MHKRDHEAAAFIMHHFKKDVADPHGFDLVINSGVLGIAQATELVRQAYRAKFDQMPGARDSEGGCEQPVARADGVRTAPADTGALEFATATSR